MDHRSVLIGGMLLLLVLLVGFDLYRSDWSPAAQATEAGAALARAAVAGDQERVAAMLSADADVTADQVIATYRDLRNPRAHEGRKALPNRTGVEYIVTVGGSSPDGYTKTTLLALRRENGRWMVVRAGSHLTY